MKKIILDKEKCIGCGLCANLCPDYFKWNSKKMKPELIKGKPIGKSQKEELEIKDFDSASEAEAGCAVGAITIE